MTEKIIDNTQIPVKYKEWTLDDVKKGIIYTGLFIAGMLVEWLWFAINKDLGETNILYALFFVFGMLLSLTMIVAIGGPERDYEEEKYE